MPEGRNVREENTKETKQEEEEKKSKKFIGSNCRTNDISLSNTHL